MCRRKWSKHRLLTTCFNALSFVLVANLVETFSEVPYDGRWGSMLLAVSALLELAPYLPHCWSVDKFTFGKGIRKKRM